MTCVGAWFCGGWAHMLVAVVTCSFCMHACDVVTGIPEWLGRLSNLTMLDLGHNLLKSEYGGPAESGGG